MLSRACSLKWLYFQKDSEKSILTCIEHISRWNFYPASVISKQNRQHKRSNSHLMDNFCYTLVTPSNYIICNLVLIIIIIIWFWLYFYCQYTFIVFLFQVWPLTYLIVYLINIKLNCGMVSSFRHIKITKYISFLSFLIKYFLHWVYAYHSDLNIKLLIYN